MMKDYPDRMTAEEVRRFGEDVVNWSRRNR